MKESFCFSFFIYFSLHFVFLIQRYCTIYITYKDMYLTNKEVLAVHSTVIKHDARLRTRGKCQFVENICLVLTRDHYFVLMISLYKLRVSPSRDILNIVSQKSLPQCLSVMLERRDARIVICSDSNSNHLLLSL